MTETLTADELLADEECRANSYKLLAECFQTPDEELITLIEDIEREEDLRLAVQSITDEVPEDIESLRVEYAKLFVGPFEVLAPPYGSVYLDNSERVMTDSTMDVMDRYREVGLDTDIDEPADHVAAELEFMYVLLVREIEAISKSNHDDAVEYLRRQQDFLNRHLGRWIADFTDEVTDYAETDFYRTLARETESFVTNDVDRVADRLAPIEADGVDGRLWEDV